MFNSQKNSFYISNKMNNYNKEIPVNLGDEFPGYNIKKLEKRPRRLSDIMNMVYNDDFSQDF